MAVENRDKKEQKYPTLSITIHQRLELRGGGTNLVS